MLSLERPLVLILGVAAVGGVSLFLRSRKYAAAVPVSLGPPGSEPFKPPIGVGAIVTVMRVAEFIGILSLFVAASGPISVTDQVVWLARGGDILFVLDCSPSMSGRDMDGRSRFETAKQLIRGFVEERGADAVGLIAVGGDAALLIPPTVDRRAFNARLDSLSIAELGDGTALGSGLSIAALHLRSSRAPRRAAVLITDGENNAGEIHPATAAAALKAVGVSLWIIGVGSSGQVAIDYIDPETGKRRVGMLDSRFDGNFLRSIASAGGGSYLNAPTASALSDAFASFSASSAFPVASRTEPRIEPLYLPFVVVGLALVSISRILRRQMLGGLI